MSAKRGCRLYGGNDVWVALAGDDATKARLWIDDGNFGVNYQMNREAWIKLRAAIDELLADWPETEAKSK